ncbi:MAG: hypothetical protein ACE5GX_11750 [Thermoanaerobaculia bacterium]
MKRWIARLVALALLWIIFPGVMEATENLAHIVRSGHLAHAAEDGDSHSDPGPEHGCNGTFHLCSCHLTQAGLLAAAGPAAAGADEGLLFVDRGDGAASGHQHNIEHPPRS